MSDDLSRRSTAGAEADLSRRSAAGAEAERLDCVIDQVAREMTEGAPPSDFRARVVALATNPEARSPNPSRPRWIWTLAPIAAAAVVVLVMFGVRSFDRRAESPAPLFSGSPGAMQRSVPNVAQPSAPNVAQPFRAAEPSAPTIMQTAPRSPSPPSGFGGTGKPDTTDRSRAANLSRATAASDIDALAPPPLVAASIGIDTLTTESIAVEQLETIAPITVAPLADPESSNDERRDQ